MVGLEDWRMKERTGVWNPCMYISTTASTIAAEMKLLR